MQLVESINHTSSANLYTIMQTLKNIENRIVALDFETASKWSDAEKDEIKQYMEEREIDRLTKRELRQYLESSGLSHPSLTYITHLSVAWSDQDSFVAVLDTDYKRRVVLKWLVSDNRKQIWHNYSFDGKLIMYHTGRLSKDYEDTEVLSKTLLNHTDILQAKSGLKHLMGYRYGDWAVSKDNFNIDNLYDKDLIKYAAIDACATYALWEEMNEATGERVDLGLSSPIDLLPLPEPRSQEYPDGWFYENVAKHLIGDTIRIMHNGLPIDLDRVYELEIELDSILEGVQHTIDNNKWIKEFQEAMFPQKSAELRAEVEAKMRGPDYYYQPFTLEKARAVANRSIYMNLFIEEHAEELFDIVTPIEEIIEGVPKWTVRDIKPYVDKFPELNRLLKKTISPDEPRAEAAARQFAILKSEIYNRSYLTQIANINFNDVMGSFNPGSSLQKRKFFDWVGVEPIAFSKDTGEPSYGREQIEELQRSEDDPDLLELYQAFVDFSFAAIVRNNFINAFYKYTVLMGDGSTRLFGSYKLLGAKSARYTSNNPNLLNLPSTGSIYAAPVKRCLTAPPGFIVATADFNALEDRVLASLTLDEGKCSIIEKGLDGHCYNALGYYKDQVESVIGEEGTYEEKVTRFKDQCSSNKTLKKLRQDSKPNTFKLAYGGYPDADKGGSITQEIFDNYHNVLYGGVKKYTNEYVLKTSQENKRLHLGMGFYIRTDNAERDIRTLHNNTCQFWSILTALAINKMHELIDANNLQDDILVTSTIYDSIYFIVRKDPYIVKWLNDTLIPVMNTDFMVNQRIKNDCALDIGPDWNTLTELSHDASIEYIQGVLDEM
jgi:hypothetical protein